MLFQNNSHENSKARSSTKNIYLIYCNLASKGLNGKLRKLFGDSKK